MRTATARTLFSLLPLLLLYVATACGGSSDDAGLFEADAGNAIDCPAKSPPSGAACSLAAGTVCAYGCSEGGPSTATCTGSAWSVAVLEIACIASGDDAGADATPPPANAPFACGTQICGVTQYCEQPCCGGIAPPCQAMGDAGVCPSGWHSAFCTPTGADLSGQNCQADPCTPPPPTCVDAPDPDGWCSPSPAGWRNLTCVCG